MPSPKKTGTGSYGGSGDGTNSTHATPLACIFPPARYASVRVTVSTLPFITYIQVSLLKIHLSYSESYPSLPSIISHPSTNGSKCLENRKSGSVGCPTKRGSWSTCHIISYVSPLGNVIVPSAHGRMHDPPPPLFGIGSEGCDNGGGGFAFGSIGLV